MSQVPQPTSPFNPTFLPRLVLLEQHTRIMKRHEQDFVDQLRKLYDAREWAAELGFTLWSPTERQLNWMSRILDDYGIR